jgi:hypothetical protein
MISYMLILSNAAGVAQDAPAGMNITCLGIKWLTRQRVENSRPN